MSLGHGDDIIYDLTDFVFQKTFINNVLFGSSL